MSCLRLVSNADVVLALDGTAADDQPVSTASGWSVMDRGGDVEFLPDGAGPAQGEEALEIGHPWRPPHWFWLVAAAVVGALVVVIAVSRHGSGHPVAAVTPSPSLSSLPTSPSVGGPPPLTSGSAALDVVASGRVVWVLQPGHLMLLDDLATRQSAGSFTLDRLDPNNSQALIIDRGGSALWVVVEGGSTGQVIEFDAFTLNQRRTLTLPAITGAAALDGHLYVTSGGRLIDIAPRTAPRVVATLPGKGSFGPVAADPTRSQLLVMDEGFPSHLWTYRPGGKLAMTPGPLSFGKGSIAVAGGAVWVGGYGQSGAALLRLGTGSSPSDLTPVDISPLTGALGPGALIVASGQRVFWVRSGGGGDDLWCVDAVTGRVAQHWNQDGAVASTDGTAVVATSDGVLPLRLSGCAG